MQATHFIKALAVTAFCASAFNALAATQTWRFTGTVDHLSSGTSAAFIAPDWLAPNQSVVIDYAIDMSTPLSGGIYSGAIKSMSFHGQSLDVSGYILSNGGLFALNASLPSAQTGGVDFMSFNVFNSAVTAAGLDLNTRLNMVSQNPFGSMNQLRIDFGNTASVYLRPQSFSAQAVPEPGTLSLSVLAASMFIGAGAFQRMRKSR